MLPLKTLFEIISPKKVNRLLSSFTCKIDKDVENFIRSKAVLFEGQMKSRTYLIVNKFDSLKNIKVLAYFTVALKVLKLTGGVSRTQRKKLNGLNKEITEIPCYLIGQLGKNDPYQNDITGQAILKYSMMVIQKAFEAVAGRIVLVECIDNEKLLEFYLKNDFTILQKDKLVQLVSHLS